MVLNYRLLFTTSKLCIKMHCTYYIANRDIILIKFNATQTDVERIVVREKCVLDCRQCLQPDLTEDVRLIVRNMEVSNVHIYCTQLYISNFYLTQMFSKIKPVPHTNKTNRILIIWIVKAIKKYKKLKEYKRLVGCKDYFNRTYCTHLSVYSISCI